MAILGLEDLQETEGNTAVLPSLYVAVAVNFRDVRLAMVGFAGEMAMETKSTGETVSVVD